MELADHVFRDRNLLEGVEHLIHNVGISGDFLLVAGFELGDVEAAKQFFHLAVGEF